MRLRAEVPINFGVDGAGFPDSFRRQGLREEQEPEPQESVNPARLKP